MNILYATTITVLLTALYECSTIVPIYNYKSFHCLHDVFLFKALSTYLLTNQETWKEGKIFNLWNSWKIINIYHTIPIPISIDCILRSSFVLIWNCRTVSVYNEVKFISKNSSDIFWKINEVLPIAIEIYCKPSQQWKQYTYLILWMSTLRPLTYTYFKLLIGFVSLKFFRRY